MIIDYIETEVFETLILCNSFAKYLPLLNKAYTAATFLVCQSKNGNDDD